ncbi:MAG: sugar ABC transporter permease [Anaerolineae bacterium]|nr:sugar ABC transporter permease [Anaerolineae bacterium]
MKPGRQKRSSLGRQEAIWGLLCISPWLLGFILFTAGPIIASFLISLTRWDIVNPPRWTGLSNYVQILTDDKDFRQALKVTTTFAAVSLPLHIGLGLGLSLLLNLKVKGMNVYRTLFYLPAVLPAVSVTFLWVWIFNPRFGLFNYLLSLVGIEGPAWFLSPRWALPGLIIMSLWGLGGGAVIYLAGLQNIPPHLYEAAEIDGANFWQRFWRITIPLLTPTLFFQLVMSLIGLFQTFVSAYVATRGGPLKSTLFYMLYLYQKAFGSLQMGYGAALAWILTVIILVLTVLVFRSSALWVYYESERPRR